MRRVMAILLQENNSGPNVIYCFFGEALIKSKIFGEEAFKVILAARIRVMKRVTWVMKRVNVYEKCNLRIQGRMQIFRKMFQKALNHVLTVPQHSTRRELSGATLKMF